ncbi:MAG: ABC transporter ATP-binding protein [Nitrososphaerota archaeon]|nr:ABC transporter ATP-binding protein [Nitrososphaerota archaeon]MDG6932092.1 ABC transporter ATP-binding protein [Nitrososphaerota archaeon]MDG6935630.1 ABC transporter ATP-binding protein [Nitrososphaerota archaeon]MDG6943545.1 ABC transporter ATP-binding protein [Nitrososphaerota archaeon]
MPSVRLENVWKNFGSTQVLKGIDLEINDGEFMILLGPSGSGKTTALRIVAGLERQDKGHVWIGDKLVDDLTPRERNIAMVFQNYALYPHKTVYENIEMPLKARKIDRADIKSRIEEISKTLEISSLLERYPRQLSGGQQQRVALARALVRHPQAFLLDEPLSNLDAKLRVSARSFLKSLQKELGVTTIYVTHDQAEAMAMADRIALISDGIIQQLSGPEDVYFYPKNTFVASFLGSPPINLFSGELSGGNLKFLNTNIHIGLSEQFNGHVAVGIRPEDISIAKDGIPAKVMVVEPLGHEYIITLKSGNELYKARIFGKLSISMNDDIYIAFDPGKLLVFLDNKRIWPVK